MITSFEVGAVFKIINEASPALAQILRQIRELNVAIDKARQNLASIAKGAAVGMGTALKETDALALAWGDVAKNAAAARIAIGNASAANARAALSLPAAGGAGTPVAAARDGCVVVAALMSQGPARQSLAAVMSVSAVAR